MNRIVLSILLGLLLHGISWGQCFCEPIGYDSENAVSINNVAALVNALDQAYNQNGHLTILVQPGTYQLTANLRFIGDNMSNLSIIGSTGNPEDVIIKGLGWNNSSVTHIFNVAADSFTVAHMTIGEVYYHPIQIHSNPADADDCLIQNVVFRDAKEQLLKVSAGGDLFADHGKILCCTFEFTGGIAFQYYTGGIDAHRAKDWIVKYNTFRHIRSPESNLAEHAIHFWRASNGTVVEANQIINCDRGIGFGLGSDPLSGHTGGLIMNNFVHCSRDVGIGLESAADAKVYNNTVIVENYSNSIEYRFSTTTNAHIVNNLVNAQITDRSSGSTGSLLTNYFLDNLDVFVDPDNQDYHLLTRPPQIVDQGTFLESLDADYDCEPRLIGGGMDIGADEVLLNTADVVLETNGINLYPNPTPGYFILEGDIVDYEISILNSQGASQMELNTLSSPLIINLSDFPSGLYFISIEHKAMQLLRMEKIFKM